MQSAEASFDFPPVRNVFLADPGYTIIDIDLAGADARVVAWDSGEPKYKAAFRAGLKIHAVNALNIFGAARAGENGRRDPWYTKAKKGGHATTYGAKVSALASRCGMTRREAKDFQDIFFETYPGILDWQRRIEFEIQTNRILYNKFGYRFPVFDRPETAVTAGFAWRPQSTVAEVTFRAMRLIDKELPLIQQLLQCHDSLVFQLPTRTLHSTMSRVHDLIHSIEIPFDDPLIIPWGIKISDISWGLAKDIGWREVINGEAIQ
jgi:DNA polymerase-1